jgi:uncharacterized surface anchored protein
MVRLFRRKKSPSKPKPKVKERSPRPAAPVEKGTIRGEVKYPWGTVAHANTTAGDRSAVTDGTGNYEIMGLDPGDYSVRAKAPFQGYEAAQRSVTLAAGETKVVDFYLDFEKTTVHGYVYGADGKPVAGATLSGVISGKAVETAVTDKKGYFKFENLSPGNQFIRVDSAGYMGETRDFTAKKGEETRLEFHLTPSSCKVHGTVMDENDRPLRAEVVLSSEFGVILEKTQTNAETGYYEFPVLPGTYNLLGMAAEYQLKGWRGSISADQKLDLKLEPSRRFSPPSVSSHMPDERRIRPPW